MLFLAAGSRVRDAEQLINTGWFSGRDADGLKRRWPGMAALAPQACRDLSGRRISIQARSNAFAASLFAASLARQPVTVRPQNQLSRCGMPLSVQKNQAINASQANRMQVDTSSSSLVCTLLAAERQPKQLSILQRGRAAHFERPQAKSDNND